MAFFTKDYIDFFKDLGANNNRDWFNANKPRFLTSVKEPFNNFISDMILRTAEVDVRFSIAPEKAIFRIYRDVRFSKDKLPYKMHMSAVISPGGRKEGMGIPGMYLQLGAEDVRFYSGLYLPDKKMLHKVRLYIAQNAAQFDRLVSDATFISKFDELRGEKNKVIPKELKEAAVEQPFLYNKQFYFFATMPPEAMLEDDFSDRIMDYFEASAPLRNYLTKARGL